MAVFRDPADALETVISIQEQLEAFNRDRPAAEQLVLRTGLHCGPCIAINANDLLDYFGAAVNFAARIEGLGQGGDIILTEEMRADPGVQALLEARRLELEPFQAAVKGFEGEYSMYRLRPGRPAGILSRTAQRAIPAP
jgi:class 3 adenylate cyclase